MANKVRVPHIIFLISTSLLAIGLAYLFFIVGKQELYWDAANYYQLGERIAREGFFNFHDRTRTFGYPLFIAVIWWLSDHFTSTVRFLVFNVQLVIFLGTCIFAFYVFKRIFQRIDLALCLFAVLALNPFLLIYTGVVLSDALSAILILLAFLFSIQADNHDRLVGGSQTKMTNQQVRRFLSFFSAGCAIMVRPANLPIVLALTAIWFFRHLAGEKTTVRSLILMIFGLGIPFIPQIIINYKAYAQIQPLVVRSLYNEQLHWGIQYLKYGTTALSGGSQSIFYFNPFLPPSISAPDVFLSRQPLEFIFTQAIHLFALFDQDYAYPYITDVHMWYRLPLAIINYGFLFGAIVGIWMWLPRFRCPKSWGQLDLALMGMLAGVIVYLPVYILVAVEPRFSLPVYLLLSPFCAIAVRQIPFQVRQQQWKLLTVQAIGLLFFLFANLSLSNWLWHQAPTLVAATSNPDTLSRYSTTDIHARFVDRIQLLSYGLDSSVKAGGGNNLYLVFTWLCNGATTEPYDIQIELRDSKNRVWAQAEHEYQDIISPCRNWLWTMQDPVIDLVMFRLPPVMPSGEYHISLDLSDRSTGQSILAYDFNGEILGTELQLATLSIAKDKASYTADQLDIENRYFVDMQEMRLLGYNELPGSQSPGSEFEIGLYWRARAKPQADYMIVIELRDSVDKIAFEQSTRPADGTYPTTQWDAGEVLLDWHDIALPNDLAEGKYDFVVQLRDAASSNIIGEANLFQISVAR